MTDPAKIFALSKLFHERVRLGIMTVLISHAQGVEFQDLRKTLKLTKGNLAGHIAKLEDAGYVEVIKEFVDKVPRTTYRATSLGRRDFAAYLSVLEDIVSHARDNV